MSFGSASGVTITAIAPEMSPTLSRSACISAGSVSPVAPWARISAPGRRDAAPMPARLAAVADSTVRWAPVSSEALRVRPFSWIGKKGCELSEAGGFQRAELAAPGRSETRALHAFVKVEAAVRQVEVQIEFGQQGCAEQAVRRDAA